MADDVVRALADARALGFLGPGPLEAHLASAQAFVDALGPSIGERALDLGSGGGVPGLVLAAAYLDVAWVLLDVHRRRTSFLARAVAELGWGGRVTVVRAAAEVAAHDPVHRERYDLVTSRSFGPTATTAECATGFLRRGGRLAVAEPPEGDRRGRWPLAGLAELGLEPIGEPGAVAVFRRSAAIGEGVPRAWRQLDKAPRWS